MTALAQPMTGASSAVVKWDSIEWNAIETQVHRLQMRIAKALREEKYGKVKSLQWLLTHSFDAKLLAVKRVTENTGKKTPGIDGVLWKNSKEKMQATQSLKRRGYQPQPLRRIYIPKKNGKQRPLGIPVMKDRAMQALHLLALEPISETQADKNSYGFRPKRSCADAIEQCFIVLAKKSSAQWILEGDICACFDKISHLWLGDNVLMDKKILQQWLKSGYMEKEVFHPTNEGTVQGGITSPTMANITFDGMEVLIKSMTNQSEKVNFVRYADDFIITGSTKEILENKIKPAIESFLKERGLKLSQEKTKITYIKDGFDFLGFNIRKFGEKLLIKPAKKNVLYFLKDIRELIKGNMTATTEELIRKLNARIRGWANYYRHVVSKETFSYVDHCIFQAIAKWAKRRHPNKNKHWLRNKYFRKQGLRNWIFSVKVRNKKRGIINFDLFLASSLPIKRHIKIRNNANPFDPKFTEYFLKRNKRSKISPRDVGNYERLLPLF